MADLNYNITPINPMPGMMQSLQLGQTLGGIRDQRSLAQLQAQAAEEAARKKAERDAQIAAAYEAVKQSPTSENYIALANLQPPEVAESTRKSFAMLDKEAQENTLRESAEVYSAFSSGNTELALEKLKRKAEAYKNAGNKKGMEDTQRLIDMASMGESGAKGVEKFFGLMIAQMPGGKDAIDAVAKFGDEQRAAAAEPTVQKKRLTDIGYTEAQTNKILAETRKLDADTKDLALELAEKKKKGGLTPKDVIDKEMQLNNTVNARTAATREATTAYENIKAGADMKNGVGDLAIVNTFMRLMSPGIVTEQDYKAATASGGIIEQVKSLKSKVEAGSLLTNEQRNQFATLAKKFANNATAQNEAQLTGIKSIVKNYGLNSENVFNERAASTTASPQPVVEADF